MLENVRKAPHVRLEEIVMIMLREKRITNIE